MRILVAAASRHGSTWEIAQTIVDALSRHGVTAELAHIEEVDDVGPYDGFVLGSAVYAGHWLKPAVAFLRTHARELQGRPVWLFSSGPIGAPLRPVEGKVVDIRQVAGLLRIKEHRIFAGRLSWRRLGLAERVVSGLSHAPQGDFRNWREVRAWAGSIAQALQRQRPAYQTWQVRP